MDNWFDAHDMACDRSAVAADDAGCIVGEQRSADPTLHRPPTGRRERTKENRAIFATILLVLTGGCAWRHRRPAFGVIVPTAHRRFTTWTAAEVFRTCIASCLTGSVLLVNPNWAGSGS